MINVALIGAGGMGRVHLRCYRNNPAARVVAICDAQATALRDAGVIQLCRDPAAPDPYSLESVAILDDFHEVLLREDVRLVDICLPTALHAQVAVAALRAGKDVFCEKPLAMDEGQCQSIEVVWQDVRSSGRQFTVGHSLRYMPQYTIAQGVIASGRYGRPLYARFHRSGGMPVGSYNNWLLCGPQSGGAVLDLHVHDIDIAHWWFGADHSIRASGLVRDGLPLLADSLWRYPDGLLVCLHAGWDLHGGPFRFAFGVMMEKGSIAYDSACDTAAVRLYEPTSQEPQRLVFPDVSPNQLQIDDILEALHNGRPINRVTLHDGSRAVAVASETLRQLSVPRIFEDKSHD